MMESLASFMVGVQQEMKKDIGFYSNPSAGCDENLDELECTNCGVFGLADADTETCPSCGKNTLAWV